MDESGTIQAQPLGCIKICVAAIKLLRLKSLTFWGHLKTVDKGCFLNKYLAKLLNKQKRVLVPWRGFCFLNLIETTVTDNLSARPLTGGCFLNVVLMPRWFWWLLWVSQVLVPWRGFCFFNWRNRQNCCKHTRRLVLVPCRGFCFFNCQQLWNKKWTN